MFVTVWCCLVILRICFMDLILFAISDWREQKFCRTQNPMLLKTIKVYMSDIFLKFTFWNLHEIVIWIQWFENMKFHFGLGLKQQAVDLGLIRLKKKNYHNFFFNFHKNNDHNLFSDFHIMTLQSRVDSIKTTIPVMYTLSALVLERGE